MKIHYRIAPNSKTVEGYAIGAFFAASHTPLGWKVTHLPSGLALCDPVFDSKETAQGIVQLIELLWNGVLNQQQATLLRDADHTPEMDKVSKMLELFNADPAQIITGFVIDKVKGEVGL